MSSAYSAWGSPTSQENGGTVPLLKGRRLISFSSSGAPEAWARESGALAALKTLFDQQISAVCGIQIVDHVHFGPVTPSQTKAVIEKYLQTVRDTVAQAFPPASNAA
jgi:NAD(P)H dehydrogenase (quinone)